MRRFLFIIALCCPAILGAQNNQSTATLGTVSVTFPAPVVGDYVNGFIDVASAIPFTFVAVKGQKNIRSITVSIYTTVSSLGGTKPSTDLKVKKTGQPVSSYQSIPCCAAPGLNVDAFTVTLGSPLTDNYSSALDLRMLLNAVTDVPGTYTTGAAGLTIVFSQVAP